MRVLNGAVLAAVIGALAACASEPTKPTKLAKPTCAHVGQRLGGTPIKGSIIGGLGTRVELEACPYAWVHIAFIGETPADYKRLVEVASEREQVIVFDAVADGYIVQNDGTPLLILMSLDEFRENRGATAMANMATRY